MIRLLFLSFLLLAAPFDAFAADTPKPVDFAAAVAAAKDVPAVAALLQEQLHRPVELMLKVKDKESLAKAKTGLDDAAAKLGAIAKRLPELPVPSAADREALSKKMEEADRAHGKTNKPAVQAHMAAMPKDLKDDVMKAVDSFYKTVDIHKKVFATYFQPDKPADEAKRPAPAKP